MWKAGEPHWKDWWHIVFSGSPCGSCVSCLSERWKSSFFLGFLQERWGSAAVPSCRGLWEHFLLSDSFLPTHIVSLWVLPSWLYKRSTRWNHCFSPLVRYKRTFARADRLSPWSIVCPWFRAYRCEAMLLNFFKYLHLLSLSFKSFWRLCEGISVHNG